MASWSEWGVKIGGSIPKPDPLSKNLHANLSKIAEMRKTDIAIYYASGFLQKPNTEGILISHEDVNGFMNAIHGTSADKGLTLVLHTPGGGTYAVESIVEYLHAKFSYIEVIVPYLAMSGGAMISIASNLVILGRQSQLGPIDPQFPSDGKPLSARAIQEGFERAKSDITSDTKLAHLWAPILHNMGPSLVMESAKALLYSKGLVHNWISKRMFADEKGEEQEKIIDGIVAYFNAEQTEKDSIYVHGQRIGIQKLRELGVKVEQLEDSQELQTAVLDSYHLMTLIFEKTPTIKFITSNKGKMWAKNQLHVTRYIP